MHYITTKTLITLFTISSFLLVVSCGDAIPAEQPVDPITTTDSSTSMPDPTGTSEYNGEEKARALSADALSGTYIYKDQSSPEGGGYLVVQALDNGRMKFELDINNGPPNYHSGTATGELIMEGNTGIFTTSEFAMEGQQPCSISFLFVEDMVELEQEMGKDVTCGFGQGVVARGIYTKKNDTPIFRYEGGR